MQVRNMNAFLGVLEIMDTHRPLGDHRAIGTGPQYRVTSLIRNRPLPRTAIGP